MTSRRGFSRRVRAVLALGSIALIMAAVLVAGGAASARVTLPRNGVTAQDHVDSSSSSVEETTTSIDEATSTSEEPTSTSTSTASTSTSTSPSTSTSTTVPDTTTTVLILPSTTSTIPDGPVPSTTTLPGPGGGFGDNGDDVNEVTAPGGSIRLHGSDFMADSVVKVTLHSDPVVLGSATTDANGEFTETFKIPANTAAGAHHIVMTGTGKDGDPVTVSLDLTVTASGSSLPLTGATTMPLLILGALLVAAGLLLTRRRRRATR